MWWQRICSWLWVAATGWLANEQHLVLPPWVNWQVPLDVTVCEVPDEPSVMFSFPRYPQTLLPSIGNIFKHFEWRSESALTFFFRRG